jgi:hypothetical protein
LPEMEEPPELGRMRVGKGEIHRRQGSRLNLGACGEARMEELMRREIHRHREVTRVR